jgi:hypothetical protein
MLVFIDESGDPGMKQKPGSSPLFVITAVMFREDYPALVCDRRIAALKATLRLHGRFEFHFQSCSDRFRRLFFEAVADCDFLYHSIVLDKARVVGEEFQEKDSFFRHTTGLAFEQLHLQGARIIIDRYGSKEFRGRLAKHLKKKMNERGADVLIKNIRMERSSSNNLLQLADMVCGAVARSFDESKLNRDDFRSMIAHRKLRVDVWPPG